MACQPVWGNLCLEVRESRTLYVYINISVDFLDYSAFLATINLLVVVWYQVFLSHTDNSYLIMWIQVTIYNNNLL